MQKHYEALLIIPGSLEETAVEKIKEKALGLFTKQGAQITLNQNWERRKLAYKIKQEITGYYWLLEFNADTKILAELSHQLELMPEILRFLILQAKIKTAVELAEEEQLKAKIRARQTAAVKEELKEVSDPKSTPAASSQPITASNESAKGKVSMEDLDKKLNEILGDDLKV